MAAGEGSIIDEPGHSIEASSTERQPCRLLTLRAELRNIIYELCIVSKEPIKIRCCRACPRKMWPKWPPYNPPELMRTCRQIRQECWKIHLFQNEFMVISDCVFTIPDLYARNAHPHTPPLGHFRFECCHGHYFDLDISRGFESFIREVNCYLCPYGEWVNLRDTSGKQICCDVKTEELKACLEYMRDWARVKSQRRRALSAITIIRA
jgi:hypothetical protein